MDYCRTFSIQQSRVRYGRPSLIFGVVHHPLFKEKQMVDHPYEPTVHKHRCAQKWWLANNYFLNNGWSTIPDRGLYSSQCIIPLQPANQSSASICCIIICPQGRSVQNESYDLLYLTLIIVHTIFWGTINDRDTFPDVNRKCCHYLSQRLRQ